MTSSKARSAGLGAVATFAGFAASLAGGAVAHADETGAAFSTDHETTSCSIGRQDIQYAPADGQGKPIGDWQSADHFNRITDEPVDGILVQIRPGAKIDDANCTRTISLASYSAQGATWQTSALQGFVGVVHTTLSKSKDHDTLVVPLPTGTKDGKDCFGQLDLYFGDKVYDGKPGAGHGSLPHYPDMTTPPPKNLISAWNGADRTCGPVTPSSSSAIKPITPLSTPSSSAPSEPATPSASGSTTAPAAFTSSSPSTPPAGSTSSSPSTPALAHTGSNAGAISLVALAFFGAGGATVMASRRAAARKH